VLAFEGGWRRRADPLNSVFLGDPLDQAAITSEGTEAGAFLSQLLPTGGAVSFRTRAARQTTDAITTLLSPAYDTQVGVELRQPLLRHRGVDSARLARDVAASDHDRANALLRRTVSETVAAVEQAYWRLVAARLEVGVREEAMGLAEEQLTETRVRIEGGAVPETELAQPRAELERRRGEFLAASEALAVAENGLKVLILEDSGDVLWQDDLVPIENAEAEAAPLEVEGAEARALAARPELVAAAGVVDRRRSETEFARDEVWPTLDAVLSYDRFGLAGSQNPALDDLPGPEEGGEWGDSFDVLGDGEFDDARVGLVFGIPIGNRTARANARAARNAERQAEADMARIRKSIQAEVRDAAAAVETAGQRIEAARAGREAAEVQLAAERDRYGVGLSTNFLVLTRQNDLSRAKLDEISALTDYRMARTEMARATGSLLAERGIEVGDRTD
jgi:outer membrane protein TolC